MTLSKDECVVVAQACMANSHSKYHDAIALSKIGSFGNACSQLMLSLEEMMKATILFMDANGFQFRHKVKGIKSLFDNHKLRYFLAFALSVINVFGQDLKKLVIWAQKNSDQLEKMKISSEENQTFLMTWLMEKIDFLTKEVLWFSNAEIYRQEGFYVDYVDGIKSPLLMTEEQFIEFKLRIDNFRMFIDEFIKSFDLTDEKNIMKDEIVKLQKRFIKDDYYRLIGTLVVKLNNRDNNAFSEMFQLMSETVSDFRRDPSFFKLQLED